ncbi:MAG: TauD/TfdA family dioxygenase, partial [Tistlia sp.]
MAITALQVLERTLRVTWDDGGAEEFHHLWLRDHGVAAGDLHADTRERVVDFHALQPDLRPLEAELEGEETIRVVWSDRRETRHDGGWLRAHTYAPGRGTGLGSAREPWRAEMVEHLPFFDYREVVESEAIQLRFLRGLVRDGFSLLTGAPSAEGEVERLAGHLGYLREICFGRLRDIRVEPSAYNIAFTDDVVKPHTDLANYAWPPGVQFLHCLVQEASGGETRLVDGLAAANDLRAEDREAFDALTRVEVEFQISNRDYDVRAASPILVAGTDIALFSPGAKASAE